jgi:hypothetical protein
VSDRFVRFQEAIKKGNLVLDTRDELAFLKSVLAGLEISEQTQMLATGAISLQSRLISPRRPRALYYNDDTFVGWVPGGRIEVISVDPSLGPIFYIFDKLNTGGSGLGAPVPKVSRAENCMNCHAPAWLKNAPSLIVESTIPAWTGGSEKGFRREKIGHTVPYADRFGGWIVTGVGPKFPPHQGNKVIERRGPELTEIPTLPGQYYDATLYPHAASDAISQLIHEHIAGFVNLATQTVYAARVNRASNPATPLTEAMARALTAPLAAYALFQGEPPMHPASITVSTAFAEAFQAGSPTQNAAARALRQIDGKTRLFANRLSFMVDSASFKGLEPPLQKAFWQQIREAVNGGALGSHLEPAERSRLLVLVPAISGAS